MHNKSHKITFMIACILLAFYINSYAIQAISVYSLDGRKATFQLQPEQTVKDLKVLVSQRFNLTQCNLRLIQDGDVLTDNTRIKSLDKTDKITVRYVGAPFSGSRCQSYHAPPKL